MAAETPQIAPPVPDRSVDKRWTPALMRDGFTPISIFFLDHYAQLKCTHAEAMFLIHLVRYKWGADAPYPSLKTIAKLMGISSQMARCHARNLEKKSLLNRVMRKGETNRFDLAPLFTALEAHQAIEAAKKARNDSAEESLVEERASPAAKKMILELRQALKKAQQDAADAKALGAKGAA